VATNLNGGLEWIYESAQQEGWSPAVNDLVIYSQVDPLGFFIGTLNGKIIGCISGVKFDENYGFLGYFIVHPDHRGQGYGQQLWNHAMAYLENRVIGLDGVVDQIPRYQKSGFLISHAHRRMKGLPRSPQASSIVDGTHQIKELEENDIKDLMGFDRSYFPPSAARQTWLHCLFADPTISCLISRNEEGTPVGYGALRPCTTGYRLSPLFAMDNSVAHHLLSYFRSKIPSDSYLLIDIPDCNPHIEPLIRAHDLEPLWSCARMYNTANVPQEIDWCGVYGVSSLELG
jgi:GNAT superfamily N-acetyltransferase